MLSLQISYSHRQIPLYLYCRLVDCKTARLGDQPDITWKWGIYLGTEARTPDSQDGIQHGTHILPLLKYQNQILNPASMCFV